MSFPSVYELVSLPLTLGGCAVFGILFLRIGVRHKTPLSTLIGTLLIASVLYLTLYTPADVQHATKPPSAITWLTHLDEALLQSQNLQRPVMVDLYAQWCTACDAFEKETFSDPSIQRYLADTFILVRIDFSTMTDDAHHFAKRYEIMGLPTILFLKPDSHEIADSRITGFMDPQQFLVHLKKIQYTEHQ